MSQKNKKELMNNTRIGSTRRRFLAGAAGSTLGLSVAKKVIAQVTGPPDSAICAADVLPQPESPFKGKIAFSAKDSVPDWPRPPKAPSGAPNIVVILLDDAGFGAASAFGGPVQAPTLDQLAAHGLRYNRFHVTSICSPTRAALLSGRNDHRAGFGTVTEVARGFPGYNGIWKKSVVSVAEVLRRNGYSTAAFGKWHNTPYWEITPVGPFDRWPTGLGFEHFYGFMSGVDSQWEPSLYRNTSPIEPPAVPEQGYHLTTDIADEAIRWVRTHESLAPEKPYFVYFATGATHAPHHVPKEWIAKYRGRFDQGWNKLREETFARQKKLGVVPANAELTAWPKELPIWDSFNGDQKKLFARQMEVYAGFLAQTDCEVGRLLQAVQGSSRGDNTLILYIGGDNGGSSEAGPEGSDADRPLQERLLRLDELGSEVYSINQYAGGWGLATNTPFQWSKQVASHFGGTRAPLVISWLARIKDHGGLRSQFSHVNDVAATLYEVTGIPFPTVVDGVQQKALDGTSFAYTFDDPSAPSRHRVQLFENLGNRAIYQDGWIAGARHSIPWDWGGSDDFEHDRWELYHVNEDFSEAHDLAAQYPDKLKALQEVFDAEARKNDVYPLGNLVNNKAEGWGELTPVAGKRKFVYYAGLPRLSHVATPDFSRSHRTTAEVVIPESGAEGVIISSGGRYGGFALYVRLDHLIYENNNGPFTGNVAITSSITVPRGKVTLAYEFVSDQRQPKKAEQSKTGNSGVVRLYINNRPVGEAPLAHIGQNRGSLGIAQAFGSPVSSAYRPPFKFSGALEKVTVQLK